MIDRPVVIVGMMRSGGALVAAVVHRLGWHPGIHTFMPQPPSWRLDYEDPELSNLLVRRSGVLMPPLRWENYLQRRRVMSGAFGFEGRIALKCPYLVLRWKDMLQAFGEPAPIVIRVYRDQAGVDASMAAHPALKQSDQEDIKKALYWDVSPDIELSYDRLVDDPEGSVRALASALGQGDDAAIRRAVELVGKPTEYPCLASP